ncbi:MFS transporter [Bdellovibrio sp. NC01]|uniref:MFS transporter n=1 Tax=Bdellovibrio sp. NC01 TaxID=2220073 RepID=UPI00115AB681|nr:MFS transporter [Bdellovibrio sp. NC01]QDK39314.1 MFS transporter [Bdellovibrio sp. NC01]
MEKTAAPVAKFDSYQKFIIAILAFLQFTIILDFMIMSPLGATMMPALNITTAQFGLVVSAYAFSAGISGFLAAGFADRFDRKNMLMFFYLGFVAGTLFCALAPNYEMLLAARIITGLFGGVIGSIVMAITTDIFPMHMRGRVMGFLQTAFAASQILGLPSGLFLSNHFGWHAPFLMIVAVSTIVGFIIWFKMKPVNEHLQYKVDKHPLHHLLGTITNTQYTTSYLAVAFLSIGGFMLLPFGSAFTVNNLGIALEKLPMIYLITGCFSILIGPLVGRLCDSFGNLKTFIFGSMLSAVMVIIYTHLGVTPLAAVVVVNVIMFIGIFSRMIPAQTIMSGVPEQTSRGAYMSVSASIQQVAGGLASVVAGMIVMRGADGKLEHFDRVGYVMLGTICIALGLMIFINKAVRERRQANSAAS